MGNWYSVFKKIKGHVYAYTQKTWREGKHVRTSSHYMGKGSRFAALAQAAGGTRLTLQGHEPALKLRTLSEQEAQALWLEDKLITLQTVDVATASDKALFDYSGRGYQQINKALRGDIPLTSELKQQILWMRKSLSDPRAVLNHNTTLFRAGLIRFDHLEVGGVVEDTGFLSCTVSRATAEGWLKSMTEEMPYYNKALFKIIGRKGEQGFVSMRGHSLADEDEVICRASQLRILAIEKDKKRWTLTVERVRLKP